MRIRHWQEKYFILRGLTIQFGLLVKIKKLITEMAYNTFQHEDELPLYLHEFKSLKTHRFKTTSKSHLQPMLFN